MRDINLGMGYASMLRDLFAVLGIVENSRDIERKPGLVEKIVNHSLRYADTQSEYRQDCPYAERLRICLFKARSSDLSQLVEKQVIVCMDQRFANRVANLFDADLYAAYYDDGNKKVLALHDSGGPPTSIWGGGIGEWAGYAIEELAGDYLSRNHSPSFLLGCVSKNFYWENGYSFGNELAKNPNLREPPLKKDTTNVRNFSMM